MKNFILLLTDAVMVAVLVMTLGACEEAQQDGSGTGENVNVNVNVNDCEVYVRKVDIAEHEYFLVYSTCDGRHGHTVKACEKPNCFLRHSHDCPCMKTRPAVSTEIDDDDEDSSDPFNW